MNNFNDIYERRMRQWLRSLTPAARVPVWNPELNQRSCILIPIAYYRNTAKTGLLIRAGLYQLKTKVMISN